MWNRPCASAPKRKAIPLFDQLNNLNLTQIKTMKRILLTLALIATAAFGNFLSRADTSTNTPPPLPAASLDQRVASLEAYISNGDPTAPLKDTNGNITVTSPIMKIGRAHG